MAKDWSKIAINEANLVEKNIVSAFEHAKNCGEALIEVKKSLAHGEWLPWIEANMPIKKSQCYDYIRLFENKQYLENSGTPETSIRAALEEIDKAKAEEKRKAEVEKRKAYEEKQKAYESSPEFMAKKAKENEEKAKEEEAKKRFKDEADRRHAEYAKEKFRKQTEEMFDEFLGVKLNKNDPYFRLGVLILKIGDEKLEKTIFKLLKQYAHPDKGNHDDVLFKEILKLEGELNGT